MSFPVMSKATPSNFELFFPKIPTAKTIENNICSSAELTLNIFGVILPSVTVPPLEIDWQGTKRKVAGSPMEFEIMTTQFIVDASFKNWKLLWNWMRLMSNNKDKMTEQYSNYAVDSTLQIIDNFNETALAVKFIGMWPTNLQEVSFSHKEAEIQLESSVTLIYDYFEIVEYA